MTGKVALVTGASGELGRVMARTLAQCGADVAVHYLHSADKAEAVAQDVRACGVRSCTVQGDVTKQGDVFRMAQEVDRALGMPDIVVANAVIQIHPWASVLQEAPEDYESQFQSCVMQSVYLAKAFVPAMQTKKYGRYIAINTECAVEAAANSSAYVAGKRGLDGLVRTLCKEVGANQITVNQVAPGWTISDQYRAAETDDAGYRASVPLQRRGTDQEIANVVAFLASDLASFITGSYIPVCGGRIIPGL